MGSHIIQTKQNLKKLRIWDRETFFFAYKFTFNKMTRFEEVVDCNIGLRDPKNCLSPLRFPKHKVVILFSTIIIP